MARSREGARGGHVVFLTRDPVVHQQGGSTTYALGLLALLRAQGADVTLVATTGYGRSPRLFFRVVAPPPAGVQLRFPGYSRIGPWYMRPLRLKAWARMLARVAGRRKALGWVSRAMEAAYRGRLYARAWDLTPPTAAEEALAVREIQAAKATAVVANYALWGPLLGDGRLGTRRTAILMHDLLSARVARFREAGLPLDCPAITEDEELRWLAGADTVLAAQEREAEAIRPRVKGQVLVTPVVLHPRALNQSQRVPGRCLFVGSNILPNRTGLEFLLKEVWPRVRAQVPAATLVIAGTVGQALEGWVDAAERRSLGVEALGVVPDLEGEYARAAVCLVPLRLGSGIKIKLLEALGFGKAIVSTSVGVQGLERWAADAVAVADDTASFAAAVVTLLRDDRRRRAREAAALRCAEVHFGAERPLPAEFVEALL